MPKILNFVKKNHYYSKLFTSLLNRAEGPGAELLRRPRELALPGLDPEVLGPELDEGRAVRLLPRLVEIPKLILNPGCLSIAFFF